MKAYGLPLMEKKSHPPKKIKNQAKIKYYQPLKKSLPMQANVPSSVSRVIVMKNHRRLPHGASLTEAV